MSRPTESGNVCIYRTENKSNTTSRAFHTNCFEISDWLVGWLVYNHKYSITIMIKCIIDELTKYELGVKH